MAENTVKIYSYKKVWKVEKKIYSFSNIQLPTPINPYDILVFIGVALFMLLLGRVMPFTAKIPTVLRFLVIPYGLSTYLMKMKLDGKNPFKFFYGYLVYLFTVKGTFLQMFRSYPDKKGRVTLRWQCSRGL